MCNSKNSTKRVYLPWYNEFNIILFSLHFQFDILTAKKAFGNQQGDQKPKQIKDIKHYDILARRSNGTLIAVLFYAPIDIISFALIIHCR